ncbi:Dual-specificity kinase, spindle pole body (SPB) duplication and spindle checkpoint function [Coemansia sp. RSA 1933]|nr:Dual-specificity kinase, spindle pole body (SPB) duplication and spindle checkpoint function [Coemansia sp. RSA 1933]
MSMYGYSGLGGNEESRQSQTLYSSLGSSKRPTSKLFDMSIDDIDDMSDVENMNFTQYSRTAGTTQQARNNGSQSEFGSNSSFHVTASASPPFEKQESAAETRSKRSGQSLAFEGDERYMSQDMSPQHTGAAGTEFDDNRDATKYYTPAMHRESQLGPEMVTRVRFTPDDDDNNNRAESQKAGGVDTTDHSAAKTSAMETPVFKLPPGITQRSTVTSRWRRRGRLGLAKPRRNDPTMATDESNSQQDDEDNPVARMGLSESPPSSLNFLPETSAPVQNKPMFASRLARSPPRSYGSAYGSIGSDNSSQKRNSYIPMDGINAADIDHTFQASRTRQEAVHAWDRDNAAEQHEDDAGSGGLRRKRTDNSSYEIPIHRQSLDASDVSMTSNPMSRSQTPDRDSGDVNNSNRGLGKSPNALSAGSASRTSVSSGSGSAGKRSHERKVSFEENVSEEPESSESVRRHAQSPLLGGQNRPFVKSSSAGSGPSESFSQVVDRAGSPDVQRTSTAGRMAPSALGNPAMTSFSLGARHEKRSAAHGDSAMEISTRFQQYEKRMNGSSPDFKSPQGWQRGSLSAPRSAELAASVPEQGASGDIERPYADAQGSVESKLSYSHRAHSAPRGDRVAGRSHVLEEYAAERRGAGYISPKLSARRAALDNNFDSLRKASPEVHAVDSQPEAASDSRRSSGSKPKVSSVSALSVAALSTPAVQNDTGLQDRYASAVAQAVAKNPYAEKHARFESQSQVSLQPQQESQVTEQQPTPQVQQQHQRQTKQQLSSRNGVDPKRSIVVNGRVYEKISITGRGGSSKVYKAMSAKHEIFAIKRVSFSRADVQAIEGYVNEIILLRKFEGNPYIVQLFDAEISKERGLLHMVMEFGETDLASVLRRQGDRPLGMNMIRMYWEQMLRAVQTIHDARVIHADLKPANYLLVKGALKLIDFGIAKAIGNDTTNIHRESQIGTVNYMSPEAIKEDNVENRENGKPVMKLGKASDVWSLGIILYQMCYGQTPFADMTLLQKLNSIPNPMAPIEYPKYMAGARRSDSDCNPNASESPTYPDGTEKVRVPHDLLCVIKACLQRDPAKRMTIPNLLADPLLCPMSMDEAMPSAISQLMTFLKGSPHLLDQWGISSAQDEKILNSLSRSLYEKERLENDRRERERLSKRA